MCSVLPLKLVIAVLNYTRIIFISDWIDKTLLIQFVMMTAFQSDPIGWDEPGYLSNDACRTMFRKWLIITHPTESPKNIKVYAYIYYCNLRQESLIL